VVIGYDAIWKGKEKDMAELYGTWEENFQQLLSWKAVVIEVSPSISHHTGMSTLPQCGLN
jgi:hypothetical protein